MGMTMTQKILAAHAGLETVEAGQLIEGRLDLVLGNDITAPVAIAEFYNKTKPKKIVNFSMFLHVEAPLYRDIEKGLFVPADELENLEEEKRLLELLDVDGVEYDGFHDFVKVRVRGVLPKDREKMIAKVEEGIETYKNKESVYAKVGGCCCELDCYQMTDPDFR